ncbi:MAG: TetR/AcrR family transcriptional regulator [Candidatus Eiseniibacteriota bacterium]|jgi:AcrR family transcriptional regulator
MSGDARRRQIIDVAARVFAEHGFKGTTTREIARAAAINEAVLYQHFSGKDALFVAALEAKIGEVEIDRFLETLPREAPIEQVMESIAVKILSVGLGDPIIQRLLIAASIEGSGDARRLFLSWRLPFISYIQQAIQRGIERGELREVDPLITARAFVGLVMDCVLSCTLWPDLGYESSEPQTLVRNNVPIFVRGLKRTD